MLKGFASSLRSTVLPLIFCGLSLTEVLAQPSAPAPLPESAVIAPSPAPTATTTEDATIAAVTRFTQNYVQAFNAHKLDDVLALWRPAGEYVDATSGTRTSGKADLKAAFGEVFKNNPQVQLTINIQTIRPVTKDVLIVEGLVSTSAPDADLQVTNYEAVLVNEGDAWLLDSVKESDAVGGQAILKSLGWLVGDWRDETDDISIESRVRWSSQEAFLIRSYKVRVGEEISHEGTQIIGWDANQKTVRSWNFESDGAFGEGIWTLNAGEWTIRNIVTLADGTKGSSRQIIRPESADAYTVEAVGREVAGVPLPSTGEIRVVRVGDGDATEAVTTDSTPPSVPAK
ncbi:MAG: hypothetical protein C0478_04985 [Planctomyces sp.]|nr:hypothetical protein [Planctomyces sp.]